MSLSSFVGCFVNFIFYLGPHWTPGIAYLVFTSMIIKHANIHSFATLKPRGFVSKLELDAEEISFETILYLANVNLLQFHTGKST